MLSVKNFVRLLDFDIIFFQEVESENIDLNDFNIIYNINEEKRGTAIALRQQIKYSNIEKSLDSRMIVARINENITLCNIYAPSGTQHKQYRERFFNINLAYYLRNITDYLIIGGDFNSVINERDSTGNSNYSFALKTTTQNLQLLDTWEVRNGTRVEYTFVRPGVGARLDRIYVSKNLKDNVRGTEIHVNSFSDHKSYTTTIKLPNLGQRYGRGIWRLNNSILDDQSVMAEFETKWQYWVRQKRQYRSWYEWWVNFAKEKIKSFFKWKTSEKYHKNNDTLEFFYTSLKRLYEEYRFNPAVRPNINKIKARMIKVQAEFSKNITSQSDMFIAGENLSTLQLGEKLKRKNNTKIKKSEA